MLEIHQFSCLSDNYGFLLHDAETGETATIDTPDATAILAALEEKGWRLTHILNTHHHADHAGGNLELKQKTGCLIVGAGHDAGRIPGIDIKVREGDHCQLGNYKFQVIEVSGHTIGHIAYWCAQEKIAFVGDTLFALGCGRLFEGSPEQMWGSLQKLMNLPEDTALYCAHEYTQANLAFALTVEPGNEALHKRGREIAALRAENKPTVPMTLKQELATNPFLRPSSANLQQTIGLVGSAPVEVFAETRRRKDNF